MDSEPLISVTQSPNAPRPTPKGRPVDLVAAILSAFAGLAAFVITLVFFLGFAENDSNFAGLLSAFAFSVVLGSFAIGPAFYIAFLAYKGWKAGLARKSAWRALFLSLPWVVLSVILILQTPVPASLSWLILVFASLLVLWSGLSLIVQTPHNASRNIDE